MASSAQICESGHTLQQRYCALHEVISDICSTTMSGESQSIPSVATGTQHDVDAFSEEAILVTQSLQKRATYSRL
jgi:hypothetical protein